MKHKTEDHNSSEEHTWARKPKAPIVMSNVDNLQVLYEDNHLIAVNK